LDDGHVSGGDPTGSTEADIALESASFVNRLAELKIPVTVDAYGNGTHSQPYFERDLHNAFPLILKALGE
jgi:S-formylglutathione hydrolase FrmB